MRVCHFTTVHDPTDVRVFYRECRSLVKNGYDVDLLIQAREIHHKEGVRILPLQKYKSRLKRFTLGQLSLWKYLLKEPYALYHFHDPELIPTGLILRLMGKKVVYDVHENVSKQIREKEWLPGRYVIARLYRSIERLVSRQFNIVLAENSYLKHFNGERLSVEVVLNMPDKDFFQPYIVKDRTSVENGIFYIGGVTKLRGALEVMKALMELKRMKVPFHFHCLGPIEEGLLQRIEGLDGFEEIKASITFYGRMSIEEGYEIAKRCKLGISILHPIENYVASYSTKIFEYMAVGMPFLTSNFELYQAVAEKSKAGVCVDPFDTIEIARAMQRFLTDDEVLMRHAANGLQAVEEHYSWQPQFEKLKRMYERLTQPSE